MTRRLSFEFLFALVVSFLVFISCAESKLGSFVAETVQTQFSSCSLLVTLNKQKWAEDHLSYIISKLKYQSSLLIAFQTNVKLPSSIKTVKQHSEPCLLGLIFISSDIIGKLVQIRNTISPNYQPIIRKDIDFFMFITNLKSQSELLQDETFFKKVKFKIAVGMVHSRLKISTLQIFGENGGASRELEIPQVDALKGRKHLFPDFVESLKGYTLRVSVPPAKSFLEVNPPPWNTKRNAKRGGWKYLFKYYLMIKFNCTYQVYRSTGMDGKFGTGGSGVQLQNGSWVGVVGDLYHGRADLGVATAKTDKRIEYIGYTDAYFDTGCLTFVTGQPFKVYSLLAMFWPFNVYLWIFLGIGTLVALSFLICVAKLLQGQTLEKTSLTTSYQIIFMLAPYLGQGLSVEPKSATLRVFLALWFFFALVVTTLYQSKLVTLLAFPVLGTLPTSFQQLALSDFEVGFMKNGDSAYSTFARSTDPVYKGLVSKMEILKGVNLTCLEKVVNRKKYACIAYDFDVEYLHQKNFSDADTRKLVYSNARTYNIWLGLATEAQSIFRVNFGKVLGQAVPFHLAQVWSKIDMYESVRQPKLEWWKNTRQTDKLIVSEDKSETDLTLANIVGVFYILMACLLGSIAVFCGEVYSSKLNSENSNRLKQWTLC